MLKCVLTSPLEQRTEDKITGIFIETVTGQRGILSRHMPIVTQLKDDSIIRLQKEIGTVKFRVGKSSFFNFANEQGIVLTQAFAEEKEY